MSSERKPIHVRLDRKYGALGVALGELDCSLIAQALHEKAREDANRARACSGHASYRSIADQFTRQSAHATTLAEMIENGESMVVIVDTAEA